MTLFRKYEMRRNVFVTEFICANTDLESEQQPASGVRIKYAITIYASPLRSQVTNVWGCVLKQVILPKCSKRVPKRGSKL